MAEFIAYRVMQAYDRGGLEAGQTKYRSYFSTTALWNRWKEDCDTILTIEGYADCIA